MTRRDRSVRLFFGIFFKNREADYGKLSTLAEMAAYLAAKAG